MNLYTDPEPYKRKILDRWTAVPCSEFIQLARPLSKSAKLSVPEDFSSTLSDHKIKNRVNQIKYNGFFQIRSSGEVQIFLGMIVLLVNQFPLAASSSQCTEHWAIAHWQHRHHEPRIRALSLAGTRSLRLPPPAPPTPHTTAANFSYRGQIVNPRRCSRTLCCIMFILHSLHAPPRFLNRISFPFNVSNWFPQWISFNMCFETINMNWIRNKLHFVFTCSWLKRIGRN